MPLFDDNYEPYQIDKPLDKKALPKPIFDKEPKYIDLYYKAWELAYDHVLYREDSPQKHYIDEAMKPQTIWIWDTCFMALFCRYAPDQYPGIESLNNFYYIMHDRKKNAPFKVHHPDNPPLFAWIEWEYFKLTGDKERLKWVLSENQYLQKHFSLIENARKMKMYKYAGVPLFASKKKYGFKWSGVSSGMDNTPRGRGRYSWILWLDLLAQQALSAYYIMKIADFLDKPEIRKRYKPFYDEYAKMLNKFYWNEEDGIYYDIKRFFHNKQSKVKTPAAYWPMLAEIPNKEQTSQLIKHIRNPKCLGGKIPWVTVDRRDKDFDPKGQYWRGGVWLPTAYMGIKALEKYGYHKLANKTSEDLLYSMLRTYQDFEPHTIWEAYSPIKFEPSTYKKNARLVRPDFCGWSALGPISLFIENILGFHTILAHEKRINWDLHHACRHGIKNLKWGGITSDILYEKGTIKIETTEDFTLVIKDKEFLISKGAHELEPQTEK